MKRFGIFVLLILMLLGGAQGALAEDKSEKSSGLSVSPVVIEEKAVQGVTYEKTITIENDSNFERTLYIHKHIIVPDRAGQGYTYVPLTKAEAESKTYSILDWLYYDDKPIVVQPHTKAKVPVNIVIPSELPGGGTRYGSLFFTTAGPQFEDDTDDGIDNVDNVVFGTTYGIQTIFIVQLDGVSTEEVLISSFKSRKIINGISNVDLELEINNVGNTYQKPRGHVEVKNMFGRKVATIPFNESAQMVFPGVRKTYLVNWTDSFGIGMYTAEAALVYGLSGNMNVFKTARFWVIPNWFIYVLIGFVLLVYLMFRRNKALRKKEILRSKGTGRSSSRSVGVKYKSSMTSQMIFVFLIIVIFFIILAVMMSK